MRVICPTTVGVVARGIAGREVGAAVEIRVVEGIVVAIREIVETKRTGGTMVVEKAVAREKVMMEKEKGSRRKERAKAEARKA